MSSKQESTPAQNETIKTKTDDAQTLEHATQTSSENSPPSQTNKPETNDPKVLEHVLESYPSAKNNTPQAETRTSSDNQPLSHTNKPENDNPEALKHNPESDPSAKNITEAEIQTPSKNSLPPKDALSHTTPITNNSATDADPQVQPANNESTSKPSYSPPVQEISPADDETTPKESSPPQNDSTQTADPGETLKQASVSDVPSAKKRSKWGMLRRFFTKRSQSEPSNPSQDSKDEAVVTRLDAKELQGSLIQADIDSIKKKARELGNYNEKLISAITTASADFDKLKYNGKPEDLQDLRKDMMKLKLQDPSKYKFDADEKDPLKNLQYHSKAKQVLSKEVLSKIPQLHNSNAFENSMEFKDFESRFNNLCLELKLCLLCFSVFPEKAIIRKRMMVQWWVSEGFVSEDAEAINCFDQLIKKGFIEHVTENRSLSPQCCQMHPFYRSALVMLAERAKFFNFNPKGEPTQNFSETFQSCLVGEGLISLEDFKENKENDLKDKKDNDPKEKKENDLKEKKLTVEDLEKLHLLINVDEHILEFKDKWFGKMKSLNFLYLGRWRIQAKEHIEVEDTKFLKDDLENLSNVKFLSLQGISNVTALPNSILKLSNLSILDLRACYNLETIPEKVQFLRNLTHLDMSECYLVEHMPKSLSSLKKLRVIKGFVVGTDDEGKKIPCCTLADLSDVENLMKLCIYTGMETFPDERHVAALGNLKKLSKLTITWGKKKEEKRSNGNKKDSSNADKAKKEEDKGPGNLPPTLEKLDLKCFPRPTTPYWLQFENLKDLHLKKLYIRGGKLTDFGQYQDTDEFNLLLPAKKETWKVEVLRLKYLSDIEMEWKQLLELFPGLVYLEQVSCPKLTLFPCDANGVWINKTKMEGN